MKISNHPYPSRRFELQNKTPNHKMLSALQTLIEAARDIGFPEIIANWIVFLIAFLSVVIVIINWIIKGINWIVLYRKQKLLNRDLSPYYTKFEINKATQNYIQSRFQNVAPSQDENPRRSHISAASNPMIPMFLKKAFKESEEDKFYLVLADTGMGKTTFMINLYLAYKRQPSWRKKFEIKLFPLGNPEILEDIEKVDDEVKKNTILLLDAFDEDPMASKDYSKRLKEILDKVWRFRKVVITCRTQFFPSERETPFDTGLFKFGVDGGKHFFRRLYISVFSDWDIQLYLLKRYNPLNPLNWNKLVTAKWIVNQSQDLVVRPMILSYIQDLLAETHKFKFNYEVYEVLINKWIQRESLKPGIAEKYGGVEKFQKELLKFSKSLAVNLYQSRNSRGGLFIYKRFKLRGTSFELGDLDVDWNDALEKSGWRSHSLLNRNATGFYKFSHKSILEYFLAKFALIDNKFLSEFDFDGFDTVQVFLNEMIINELINNAEGKFRKKESKDTGNSENEPFISNIDVKDLDRIQTLYFNSIDFQRISLLPFLKLKQLEIVKIRDIESNNYLYLLYDLFFEISLDEAKNKYEMDEIEKKEKAIKGFLPELKHPVEVKYNIAYTRKQEIISYLISKKFSEIQRRLEFPLPTLEHWNMELDIVDLSKANLSKNLEVLMKSNDFQLGSEFTRANTFLKYCRTAKEKFKKIKFYY